MIDKNLTLCILEKRKERKKYSTSCVVLSNILSSLTKLQKIIDYTDSTCI
jgi:hypothetical protein